MKITLKPEIEERVNERLRSGEFESADAMVERALTLFLEFEDDEMSGVDFLETKTAIREGLDQAERGETISLEEFDQNMRAKYGISR